MVTYTQTDEFRGAEFVHLSMRGARFRGVGLGDVVMRGVSVEGAEIDDPWLLEGGALTVNGVDVAPYVDAELNRRFPGRELRRAEDPAGMQQAWAALERTWAATLERAAAMPEGTVDISVDDEWSFAQTLRHLVMATDTWLRGAAQQIENPYHPIGQPNGAYYTDGHDPSVFADGTPSFAEVLEVRAERQAMVRDYLAATTPEQLAEERRNPWAPDYVETVRNCLGTILEEEWEHHRYAVRDLEAIERRGSSSAEDVENG